MKNFTVGPVQSPYRVRKIGLKQVPYFRTQEFSDLMLENEQMILKFAKASEESKVAFLTCSGTGAMEASIINTLTAKDKVLLVNGGSFGARFKKILDLHEIPNEQILLNPGQALTKKHLEAFAGDSFTAFVVNMHETSTGVLYDMNLISDYAKKHNLLLIVDAISSFLADPINIKEHGIDIMITSSQKALACPPGVSLVVLSPKALDRVGKTESKSFYFDLKEALNNQTRGQTPFTPAVSVLIQINERLKTIDKKGGYDYEMNKCKERAEYFRNHIKDLPFEIVSESLSNAVTPLKLVNKNVDAYSVFEYLKNKKKIWICPNGGELKDKIFRVGHIGDIKIRDYKKLIKCFRQMQRRNLL